MPRLSRWVRALALVGALGPMISIGASQMPTGALAAATWSDGDRVYRSLRDWVDRIDWDGSIRGLVRLGILMGQASLGMSFDEFVATVSPGAGALVWMPGRDGAVDWISISARSALDEERCRELNRRWVGRMVVESDADWLWMAASSAVLTKHRPSLRIAFEGLRDSKSPRSAELLFTVDWSMLRSDRGVGSTGSGLDGPGRLLVGGYAKQLDRANRVHGGLAVSGSELRLWASLDSILDEELANALSPHGSARFSTPPVPVDSIFELTLDRSLAEFWKRRRLMLGPIAASAAEVEFAIVDALAGASMGAELLPSLGTPWTVFAIGTSQAVDRDPTAPWIELPELVVLAPLADADAAKRMWPRLFRSFGQVAMLERRRQGKVGFAPRVRRDDAGHVAWVAEPDDWFEPGRAPTETQLQPTLSFAAGYVVVASTERAARRTIATLQNQPGRQQAGDRLEFDGRGVADYLLRNAATMTLHRVLDEGVAPAVARRDLRVAASVLRGFESIRFTSTPAADSSEFELRVRGVMR